MTFAAIVKGGTGAGRKRPKREASRDTTRIRFVGGPADNTERDERWVGRWIRDWTTNEVMYELQDGDVDGTLIYKFVG